MPTTPFRRTLAWVPIAALLGTPLPAHSQTKLPHQTSICATSGASVEYILEGRGGGFEVPVSPRMVTLLHFPEEITAAFPPNQRDYSVNVMKRSIALLPLREAVGVLNVDTKSYHVSVTVKPAPNVEKSKAQVIFTSLSDEARFDAEVESRLKPVRAELEGKLTDTTRRRTAEALLDGFAARAIEGHAARTDGNVIARPTRAITVGSDLYVHITIENRSDRPYLLAAARLVQAHKDVATKAVFETHAEDASFLGMVPRGTTGRGFLIVKLAELKAGQPVDLHLVDENKADLTIPGVRLD